MFFPVLIKNQEYFSRVGEAVGGASESDPREVPVPKPSASSSVTSTLGTPAGSDGRNPVADACEGTRAGEVKKEKEKRCTPVFYAILVAAHLYFTRF